MHQKVQLTGFVDRLALKTGFSSGTGSGACLSVCVCVCLCTISVAKLSLFSGLP